MKKKVLTAFILLPLVLLSCGALWQSEPSRGVQAARSGEYAEGVRILEPVIAAGSNDAAFVDALYYSWMGMGEYEKARQRFDSWAAARPNAGAIRLAAGRVNRFTGHYDEALAHLTAVQNAADMGVAATFERARVLQETGKVAEAEGLYGRIIQSFLNSANTPPRNLIYVARALEATDRFVDANEVYITAVKALPEDAQLLLAWGNMSSSKQRETDAIDSYRRALKIDPKMPEANLGLAKNLASTDMESAEEAYKAATEVNPNLPDAQLFAAAQYIESEQYDKALESAKKALEVNPKGAESLSVVATVYYLQGNTAEFEKAKGQVLAVNPRYSTLYYTLAEHAVSVRLYKQAVDFAREALRLNPRDWDAMTLLGINLQRIGQEAEGTQVLEAAFAGDPLNTWAGNTLNLLDSFARGDFDRFKSEHFEIKLHKSESAALKPYVVDLLEKAYTTLSAKYNFTPQGPLSFEMFPQHADFEVRAVGLTGLGALGVCFGNLFVMDSPSAKEVDHFNWGSTLWHEFTHIITLQMTDNKVPRWFSEGLSVFEERKAFPGWGDDMKLDNLKAIQAKKLLPIEELNDGFMRPKYPGQVLVSYYQASMVGDYIEGKWGFPAIRNMLLLYKAGKTTEEVFKEALNVSLETFDTEFLKWMDDKAASIEPTKYAKWLEEGEMALEENKFDEAIAPLTQAITMYPEYSDENNAWEPLAEAYLKKGDKAAAIDTLKKYLSYSETSFASFVKLAELLQENGDKAGAAKALEGAMYVRPMDMQGHAKLGTLLLDLMQYSGAAREYETLLALKTPDRASAYYFLGQAYFRQGKKSEARKAVLSSLDIAPSYEPAQKLLVEILK